MEISRPVLTCFLAAVFLVQCELASAQQFYISEFLADNQLNTKLDEDGDHSDWIEIWNSAASAASLNGWYLTDDASDLRKWRFPVTTPVISLAPGARIIIFASNKDRKLATTKLHTNFKLTKSAGGYLALVRPDGLTIEHQYNGYPQQVQDIAYGLVAPQFQTLVPAGAMGKAKVPLSAADMPTQAPAWYDVGFDASSWQSGQTGFGYDTAGLYGSLIGPGGDLQATMYNTNSLALVRIPFNVVNPALIVGLRLSMKYDDGFNCYLNGHLIQQSVPAGGTAWDSGAPADRDGSLTSTFQVFSPANNPQQWLVAGTNMLAFQILNFGNGSPEDTDAQGTPNGSRALCLPFLEGNFIVGVNSGAYLASATPGTANAAALSALGPSISQTTDKPARPLGGAGSAPIIITTKVLPTLKPLSASNPVTLRYLVMFNSETIVAMKDDGIAPDAVAGDTIYTAQIPTIAMTAGQMVRWRIVATDNANATSTDPPFRDTGDNDQYFGTVALDGITTSQLPVLHWFVADAAGSRTDGGTRCSLFYLDRFYDHVFVGLHGQSSSGFSVDKKSHDFNFNEDNRFKWKEGEIHQRAVNLITTWADKSHVRDTMAWETWALTGHIASHWSNLVRVQQNASFWGVYDMVENGDEDFPDRAGLDPYGALYKVYNSLQDVSLVEKKTRDGDPSTADLQDLITNLDPASKTLLQRRAYSYDNVDVPTLANYLATNVIVLNNDFGHKNYYVYRDTNGTREWSVLPWDQDLSIGHTWTNPQGYFNDDIHSQAGLVLGAVPGPGTTAGGNRLMDLMMNDAGNGGTIAPEMSRMFLRRIRTLMDKLLVSAANTNGPFEQRITQLVDMIDPPGAGYLTDGDLDLRKWGYWVDGGGGPISPNNTFDAATHDHGVRKQALRILNSNPNPPNPSSFTNAEGLGNTTFPFLIGRRSLLFNGNPQLNGQSIPASQPAVPTGLIIEYVEANPASANQGQEFFIIRNNSNIYVDVSGWKITGAVDYTFRGGTVIPPFTSGSAVTATGDVHAGRLHVARDPFQFRQRTTGPKGNQYRLVVGPYSGQLSARGETINLVIPGVAPAQDIVVATNTYPAAPTTAQSFLRVTELNFNPLAPTPAELAALPGVQGRDFEFIELTNTGASPLSLANASFTKGISFTFPAGFTLQGGERCVVVSLLAAYNLRYGGAGAIVAGQFEGNLDNNGETVQLLDPVGESILEFTYDPLWFGIPKLGDPGILDPPQGYSLVTQNSSPAWDVYENPATWALSETAGGSPGTGDTMFSNVFTSWRRSHFTPGEEAIPAISAPAADADLDERSNFEEFAFGGDPRAFESKPQPTAVIVNENGTDYPAITFDRRHNAVDTTYTVEVASDLGTWTSVNHPVGAPIDLGNGMERVTYRDSQPLSSGERCLRVRATR
jgi:hypothetical protein